MKRTAILLIALLLCGCTYSNPETTVPKNVNTAPTDPTITTETQAQDAIKLQLDSLTVKQKVGQLFLARCPEETALEDIAAFHLGGYILFARDFEGQTPEDLSNTLAQYQCASAIPMLIAVDEEGGTVCRVSANEAFRSSRFSSLRNLYASGGLDAILAEESEKCDLLSSIGINVNMAPVCDITTDPNAFMYKRSLGQDAKTTALCISQITELMNSKQMGSVLKHFPGYGNNKDTHLDTANDQRPLSQLEETDLLPFMAGIEADCDAILISHTIIAALDSENPASLSAPVISYLRNELHFNGVIVTDDLVMKAITKHYTPEEAAVMAILAGNDLLCSTEYRTQYTAVLKAVNAGIISMEQLDAAVYRILQWKWDLGLFES